MVHQGQPGQIVRTQVGLSAQSGGQGNPVVGITKESAQGAHMAKWEADEPLGELNS